MTALVPPDELLVIPPVEFIQGELRHTKTTRYAGKPFLLADWQRQDIIEPLFSISATSGYRRYTQALIGMPRKNGKSELGAACALKLLVADGEFGAEVYCVAGDKEQARVVFAVAKSMVQFAPALATHLKTYRDAIEDPSTGSVLKVVSADAPLKHGLNPSGVVFDEIHNQPSRDLWDVMTSGSGVRDQPLVIGITTAGSNLDTICGELWEYGMECRANPAKDPRFFFYWVGLPDDSPLSHRDPEAWQIANPALGDFLRYDYLEDECRRKPEIVFRQLHLNQWTSTMDRWIPMEEWDACAGAPEIAADDEVWVGLDFGLKHDSTAVAVVAPKGDQFHATVRIFEPTDEEIVDFVEVENYLRDLNRTYYVRRIPYDPAMAHRTSVMMRAEGLPMEEFPQSAERMAPASQLLYDSVIERRLVHDGVRGTALWRHADAGVARIVDGRAWRIDKKKATKRIDGLVALAMAMRSCLIDIGEGSPWLAWARAELDREATANETAGQED